MSRALLSNYGPVRQDFISHAHEPGKYHFQIVENTEHAIQQARRERDQEATMSQNRDMRKVATVPWVVYEQAQREGWGINEWRRHFLLNPDYRAVVYGRL